MPAIVAIVRAMCTGKSLRGCGLVSLPIPWLAAAHRSRLRAKCTSKAYGLDLRSGFNILKQRILEVVQKPSDLVLSHPPYHDMIVYSGKVWSRAGHPALPKMMVGKVESQRPFALLCLRLSRATLPKTVIVGKAIGWS
jgi:hypothetical protein